MAVYLNSEETVDSLALGEGDPLNEGQDGVEKMSEAQKNINDFWPQMMQEVKSIRVVEPGNQLLPLARIKKIMKLDEDVKMISAEAPLLFAKAAEMFIHELTLRAWLHTEDNKRRTLQRSDIAMAITKYDQFDFLIDIVPRDEIKPVKKENEVKPPVATEQFPQLYFQLTQQQQQQAQQPTQNNMVLQTTSQPQHQAPQIATIAQPTTQNIIVTNPTTGLQQVQTISNPMATNQTNLQLVQQVLTPSGELTTIPIPLTAQQLNYIRAQMQIAGTSPNTPIIIQTSPQMQAPTLIQSSTSNVYLNATQLQQVQNNHPQQQE